VSSIVPFGLVCTDRYKQYKSRTRVWQEIFQALHGLPGNALDSRTACQYNQQARRVWGGGSFFSGFTKTGDSILFADIRRYFILVDAIAELKSTKRL